MCLDSLIGSKSASANAFSHAFYVLMVLDSMLGVINMSLQVLEN